MADHPVPVPADPAGISTTALQAAIDAAHAAGGGRVVLAAGTTYRCGTIRLRSGVELHLAHGSRLVASTERSDYQEIDIAGEYGGKSGGFLIQANDAEEVAITGSGTIDGQSLAFMDGWWVDDGPYIRRPLPWRPRGVGLFGCRRVTIRDVTIRDAAQWTLHLTGCEDVLVTGISIYNRLDVPNCDGIDPDHCRNVRIIGCHIEAGDDGIVLKNTKTFADYGPCENILIQACSIVSTSAGIKIGTESQGDFRNVVVQGCTVQRSHRGLAIQLRDSGTIENILFSDCIIQTRIFHDKWWGRGEPIHVTAVPRHDGDAAGHIRHVRFRNILCTAENGILVHGSPDAPVEDLVLDGVRLAIRHDSRWPGGRRDLRPRHSQEHGGLEEADTAGVDLVHAVGVGLSDVQVAWEGEPRPWWGPALRLRSVEGLSEHGFSGSAGRPGVPDRDLDH